MLEVYYTILRILHIPVNPMPEPFFDNPILNSPYSRPMRHWELDEDNQPTHAVIESRRASSFITPVPPPRQAGSAAAQSGLVIENPEQLAHEKQQYETTSGINDVRRHVDEWRRLPNPNDWGVTYTTRQLLEHWRSDNFDRERPFFCQVEALETIIWLTEVAPHIGQTGRNILDRLRNASEDANPGLERWALKMATGSGKTTVMAMLIAWQTLNAIESRRPNVFTNNFLVVTPGITIKNRLQVLLPNHPDNYYEQRQLVPPHMLAKLHEANIVITNYHAFTPREKWNLSSYQRQVLEGRDHGVLRTKETDGQMMRRVMPLLMDRRRGVMVLNDEGHHCYRRKPGEPDESKPTGDERSEAKSNEEAARVWITGLEAIQKRVGINRIVDLSATPFFLRGSGYAEGTLFPWTVSDFGLMDAIECGIVKLPRVPVVDDAPTDQPVYRNLWRYVAKDVRTATKGAIGTLSPELVPAQLQSAIRALYANYEAVDASWKQAGIEVPPCFIIVCNSVKTSKLIFDWVSGRRYDDDDGNLRELYTAQCRLFNNFDADGAPLERPNTVLIDSQQLESGEALSAMFKRAAAAEIAGFRREVAATRGQGAADNISEAELLREVVNSVGKPGRLGANIRCVVSVSMLSEGWDANTVTHILGVRAFGTQLLCEQVVGRALRRYSYELQEDGTFEAQYADVFGVPFDFTAKPAIAPPKPPKPTTRVRALPERSDLEIRFPRIEGFTVSRDRIQTLRPIFNKDSEYRPLVDLPTEVESSAIAGETETFADPIIENTRRQQIEYHLTSQLLERVNDQDSDPSCEADPFDYRNFFALKRIVGQWIDEYLFVPEGASLALLQYPEYYNTACTKIMAAFDRQTGPVNAKVTPQINRYAPDGSSANVDLTTTKEVYRTDPDKCHVSHVVLDSTWERNMAQQLELHPNVIAYVKNAGLGLEVPYHANGQRRSYLPDFIARVNAGNDEPLNILIEVKGLRREDVAEKSTAARDYWVPATNNLAQYGRWAWAYCDDVTMFRSELDKAIRNHTAQRNTTHILPSGD